MTQSSIKDPEKESHSPDSLEEIREIIVGPEQVQLNEIKERLDNKEIRARDVSYVIAEAIMIRSASDSKLAKSLKPTIEDSIRSSISNNRRVFVDILFPLMGPAIRRAITSTIRGMIQSFNQVLENSFSIQGLKWRIEAIKTKRQFAEVVLLHTLVYQIEQVFLIHRETGLLLQHVEAKELVIQDPALISGMLTAIQDFVRDSFGKKDHEGLDSLRVGERSIWIEYSTEAILAVVIQGNPPEDYHTTLREVLDDIRLKFSDAFETFDGDAALFEASRDLLTDCIKSQFKPSTSKTSPLLWTIAVACALIVGIWVFSYFDRQKEWANLKEELSHHPGLVITQAEKQTGKYYVSGFRDPLAEDPREILNGLDIDPAKVVFRWEPFHSLDEAFMLKRINAILNPPEKVTLILDDGGLEAYGEAPHKWIVRFRTLAPTISGVSYVKDHRLIDQDEMAFHESVDQIEAAFISFDSNDTFISPEREDRLMKIVKDIHAMLALSNLLGKEVRLLIIGHADQTGMLSRNIQISNERAENVQAFLIANGVSSNLIDAAGVGERECAITDASDLDTSICRIVNFRIQGDK